MRPSTLPLRPSCITLALALALPLVPAPALAGNVPDVTNGGYMQTTLRGKAVPLPLKHTGVDARVDGVVAGVTVTQLFHNPYKKPIEAVYVFPLPHRAAVHAMTIQLGQRTIKAVVKRRAEARRVYNRAKAAGRSAALLEQQRPNIFTQSVANILPNEQIRVTLRYVEHLVPSFGRYAFVFPMVVGPRYVGGGEPLRRKSGHGWSPDTTRIRDASRITPALLKKGLRPGHDISVKVRVDAGNLPVRHPKVVAHQAAVTRQGRAVVATLSPADSVPNKDFVLRYQLAGAQPDVAVLAHRGKHQGHFLLMVQPKARMKQADIAPLEYVFVVDNSGSMSGFPLDQARAVMRRCLNNTRAGDTFQIIKFAGAPDQFAPRAVAATAGNIRAGVRYVGQMRGGGGTEFLPALRLALKAKRDPRRARVVLFITDGYIGYEQDVLRLLRKQLNGSNLFALGVGSSVNRYLIDAMARIGSGAPFYLLNQEKASSVVERIFSVVSQPALTSIEIDWGGLRVAGVSPRRAPDLFGGRPVVLTGRYDKGGSAMVTVKGRLAGQAFARKVWVTLPGTPGGARSVPLLWARQRIAELMDSYTLKPQHARQIKKQVTALALRHSLVSRFTSFVAVDSRVSNPSGKQATVPVPVPLPQGVSQAAAPVPAYLKKRVGTAGVLKLLGTNRGTAYGVGGLGLTGTGSGGGGVGLGTLGTLGRGGGGGSGVGYGSGAGLRGRRSRAPLVAAGKVAVQGALSRTIIRRVIRRHLNEVRFCYQKQLGSKPGLAGKLVLRFTIGPKGRVVSSRVARSTINSKPLATCVTRAVRRWLFPAPVGGGIVVVKYPFVFKPGGVKSAPATAPTPATPAAPIKPTPVTAAPVKPAPATAAVVQVKATKPAEVTSGCGASPVSPAGRAGALLAGLLLGLLWSRWRFARRVG